MRLGPTDTPPSSLSGDDIAGLEADELIYVGDADEVLGNDDMMNADSDGELEVQAEEDYEPPPDQSVAAFRAHTGSVFCCDLHPNGKFAATGGEDDLAYVWDVTDGREIFKCNGHKDSIIFVGFSFDGAYLATADMCGVIKVWKCNLEPVADGDSAAWPIVMEYEAGDLTWGMWHYGARVLICGVVAGEIYVFKIPSGDTKVLESHNSMVECAKMFPDGRRLAAGYEDGSIKIWDLKSAAAVHHTQPNNVHDSGVKAIDTHPDNNLVISISSNGKVLLTTATTGKIVGQIDADDNLETVAFSKDPELGYFALGTLDGRVSVWDISRQMLRHQLSNATDSDATGVTKMLWFKNYLFTSCLDGTIRVYEARAGQRIQTITGHNTEVLDFSFSQQANVILTSSEDFTARIFNFDENRVDT